MTQQIIDIGAVPDDGQGDPLRTAFDYTNENFTEIYTAGPVGSNVKIANNTITTTVLNSNLILSPSGIGKIQTNNSILPKINNVYDLGTPSQRFNTLYIGSGGLDLTGGLIVTGNVSADYFIGNGSQLTGISATDVSSIANGTSSISIPVASGNIQIEVAGVPNVINIASGIVEIDGDFSVSGTAYFNDEVVAGSADFQSISTNSITATGNITTLGNISAAGNIIAPYFIGDVVGNISGNINAPGGNTQVLFNDNYEIAASSGFTFNKTSNVLSVSGNINATNFVGNGTGLANVMADRGNDTNNWNLLIQMGIYTVNRTSWSGVTGAPIDSQVFVGLLEVKNSGNTAIEQVFYPGTVTTDVKIQWNRAYWAGSWTSWIQMTNDGQLLNGGEF